MEIRLLGPVVVGFGGAIVPLGPPRQRAVLAMLALAAPGTISTDRYTFRKPAATILDEAVGGPSTARRRLPWRQR